MRKRFDIKWKNNKMNITSKKGNGLILIGIVEEYHSVSTCSGFDSGVISRNTCNCECDCSCNDNPRNYFQDYEFGQPRFHYEGPMKLSSVEINPNEYIFCDICKKQVNTDNIIVNFECMCQYHKNCIDVYIRKDGKLCPACDVNFCRTCLHCPVSNSDWVKM